MESSLKILHLEDSQDDHELVRLAMRSDGLAFELSRVENKQDFESALTVGGFDIILCDYEIPGYGGLAAMDLAQKKCPDIPFLFVSGFLGEEKATESLKLGATDCVLKDKLSRLAPSINRALREADERRQRREAEVALVRKVAELGSSNDELQQFAFITSHHLQEPLRTTIAYAGRLASHLDGNLDAESKEYLDYIVAGASQMKELVQAITVYQDLSRQQPRKEAVQPDRLVGEIIAEFQERVRKTQANIEFSAMPGLNANESLIKLLFYHLIDNSLKFCSQEKPQIQINARDQGEYILFSVADNGIGMDCQIGNRIFDIFQRLHHQDEYPGVGIGLAICRKIVALYNGKIWVASKPDAGATFYFSLPKDVCML